MTPEQIQVGKFYLRRDYPNSRYLGVGKRKPWTFGKDMEFTEKHIAWVDFMDSMARDGQISEKLSNRATL